MKSLCINYVYPLIKVVDKYVQYSPDLKIMFDLKRSCTIPKAVQTGRRQKRVQLKAWNSARIVQLKLAYVLTFAPSYTVGRYSVKTRT